MSLLGPNTCRFLVPFGFHSGGIQNKNDAWQVNSESGLSYVRYFTCSLKQWMFNRLSEKIYFGFFLNYVEIIVWETYVLMRFKT